MTTEDDYLLIDGELWEVRQESTGGYQCEEPDCDGRVNYTIRAVAEPGYRMLCEPCLLRLSTAS